MTVTLNLPLAVEQAVLAEAQAKGVSVDELVRDLVLSVRPQSEYQKLPPDEWIRQFHEWVESHKGLDLPVLSDEAMSRDSIYEYRGLIPNTHNVPPQNVHWVLCGSRAIRFASPIRTLSSFGPSLPVRAPRTALV